MRACGAAGISRQTSPGATGAEAASGSCQYFELLRQEQEEYRVFDGNDIVADMTRFHSTHFLPGVSANTDGNNMVSCDGNGNPALYVKRFSGNYASMKTEAGNSHGKVFEDDGNRAWIWDVVAPKCLQLRERFLQGKSW